MYPHIKVFNVEIVTYNAINMIAYAIALFVFYYESRRKNYPKETILYILLWALVGGLVGSRLGSALFVYWEHYSKNFLDIFIPQLGGKTLVGGVIVGYLAVVITKKILKFNRPTGDLFAPSLAIGIAIGRVGCFFNGCCYGAATTLPWGIKYNGMFRHPTQIYEAIFCFILFIYLWMIRKKITIEGDLFKIFILIYAFFRFWIEFIRADAVNAALGLSSAQVICLIAMAIVAAYFVKRKCYSIGG